MAITDYKSLVLSDGPIAFWRLNESSGTTMGDSGATGYPGTYGSGITVNQGSIVPHDPGGASISVAALTSPANVATVPNSSALQPTSAMSLEIWAEPTGSLPTVVDAIFSPGPHPSGNYVAALTLDITLHAQARVTSGGSAKIAADANAMATGTAYHLVMTYDGAHVKLWKNSVQVSTTAATGAIGTWTSDVLSIGGAAGATPNSFSGLLQNAAIYASAISSTQIDNHYNAGINGPPVPSSTSIVFATATSSDQTVTISGGTSTFSVASNRTGVATATVSGTTVTIHPVGAGACTITITDSATLTAKVLVDVAFIGAVASSSGKARRVSAQASRRILSPTTGRRIAGITALRRIVRPSVSARQVSMTFVRLASIFTTRVRVASLMAYRYLAEATFSRRDVSIVKQASTRTRNLRIASIVPVRRAVESTGGSRVPTIGRSSIAVSRGHRSLSSAAARMIMSSVVGRRVANTIVQRAASSITFRTRQVGSLVARVGSSAVRESRQVSAAITRAIMMVSGFSRGSAISVMRRRATPSSGARVATVTDLRGASATLIGKQSGRSIIASRASVVATAAHRMGSSVVASLCASPVILQRHVSITATRVNSVVMALRRKASSVPISHRVISGLPSIRSISVTAIRESRTHVSGSQWIAVSRIASSATSHVRRASISMFRRIAVVDIGHRQMVQNLMRAALSRGASSRPMVFSKTSAVRSATATVTRKVLGLIRAAISAVRGLAAPSSVQATVILPQVTISVQTFLAPVDRE